MNNLSIQDRWGTEFFRLSDLYSLNISNYFLCLNYLKSLFGTEEFCRSTSGFYLNHIKNRHPNDDQGISVRLTYFTSDGKTLNVIKNLIVQNPNIKIYPSADREDSHPGEVSTLGEEFRFRNFLNTYTQIGLDLISGDNLIQFRELISEYMSQYFSRYISGNILFDNFLRLKSEFYNNLDESRRKEFWKDLLYCTSFNECYPHFLANMFIIADNGAMPI